MSQRLALLACGALLALFAAVSFGSVLTKAPTFDEPLQTVAGWTHLHRGDFRLDIEDPPLWEEWANLPNGSGRIPLDVTSTAWQMLPASPDVSGLFAVHTLFQTPGVDGASLVNRSRAMMLILGVLLGGFIAFWAWKLAGPIAAVVATGLFALDPNFLAHAPLVKNDVSMGLLLLVISWLAWRAGQRVTILRIVGLGLACGLAANVKFSALLLVPVLTVLFGTRVVLSAPWPVLKGDAGTRGQRLLVALGIAGTVVVLVAATIWASYDFRYAGTPDGGLDPRWVLDHLKHHQTGLLRGSMANVRPEDLAAWRPDRMTQAALWALHHHLLPEAWIDGFLYTYSTSLLRLGFLLNGQSDIGWWYYFPVVLLLKTPVATLVAAVGATVLGAWFFLRPPRRSDEWWTLLCIVIPPSVYFASALRSHMNIGVRHILPIYGFVFIACGVVAAKALARWRRPLLLSLMGLTVALAAESLTSAPNFICFFNAFVGGPENGINLLGDSNLDWGQDLNSLADWQKRHPEVNLYLSYFGMVDPAFYGIRYHPLPGNFVFGPKPTKELIQEPAVFAISATHLQGITIGMNVGNMYEEYRTKKPREILGGTIYLFDR